MAAAIADDQAAIEHELVALGVPAEIVVIVEDQDARLRSPCTAIKPGGGKPADPATDHDEIVLLLGRHIAHLKARAVAHEGMRRLERTGMLSAQPAQQRRVAAGLCGNLRGRRKPRGDAQCCAVDEIAPGD